LTFIDLKQAEACIVRRTVRRCTLQACKDQAALLLEIRTKPLVKALCLLLPRSAPQEIQVFVEEIIDKAIKLKNEMAEEPALYRVFLIAPGQPYRPSIMETFQVKSSYNDGSKVLMCTIPGVNQLRGDKSWVTILKARVMLEPL
jgi:hypothetical protein